MVSALPWNAAGAVGGDTRRRSALECRPTDTAAVATGLPVDRGASRPAAATTTAAPAAGADTAIPGDTALGSAGSRRARWCRAGFGGAASATGEPGACGVLRDHGDAGRCGPGSPVALPVADHQPEHVAQLAGG